MELIQAGNVQLMAEKDKQGNGVGQMGQRKGVQHRKEIKLVIQKAQSV